MQKEKGRFYCFSPEVMLATFLFEIGSAIYILWRYKLSAVTRLASTILVCLAVFQVAEWIVCGEQSLLWAKIGFLAITLLPPLGIHLAATIAQKHTRVLWVAYGSAVVFAATFLFAEGAIGRQVCSGNYVIFEITPHATNWYALYYYGWLLTGVGFSLRWAKTNNKRNRAALRSLAVGYASFIIPTTTVNIIAPETIAAIPSIMCGFAVLLAMMLTFKVVPEVGVRG